MGSVSAVYDRMYDAWRGQFVAGLDLEPEGEAEAYRLGREGEFLRIFKKKLEEETSEWFKKKEREEAAEREERG